MKMEQTECSETSAYKIHTPGNYPKKSYNNANVGIYFEPDKSISHSLILLLKIHFINIRPFLTRHTKSSISFRLGRNVLLVAHFSSAQYTWCDNLISGIVAACRWGAE